MLASSEDCTTGSGRIVSAVTVSTEQCGSRPRTRRVSGTTSCEFIERLLSGLCVTAAPAMLQYDSG